MVHVQVGNLMKKRGLGLAWGKTMEFEIAASASESGAGFAVGRAG